MPGNKEIGRMQQDADALQKMSASGNVDTNLAMNAMQRMATTAAKADIGSQMLKMFQMFAASIKEGIDSGVYGNRVGEMQKAYDQIIAQMPMLKQMAADSKEMGASEDQTKRDFAPTKADATYAQGDAAVLRSKVDYKPAIEMKVIINQAMKDLLKQKEKFANNVSKSSGTDPRAVDKMLAKQPPLTAKNAKFKDKFSKTNETASGMGSSSIASVPSGVGAMQSRNMYNADGTMKNGVEYGNLLGGKTKKNKKKSKKPNA